MGDKLVIVIPKESAVILVGLKTYMMKALFPLFRV